MINDEEILIDEDELIKEILMTEEFTNLPGLDELEVIATQKQTFVNVPPIEVVARPKRSISNSEIVADMELTPQKKKEKKRRKNSKSSQQLDLESISSKTKTESKRSQKCLISKFNAHCPPYEEYSEDRLKIELKQYGMKANMNTKAMISQLREIHLFLTASKTFL